ncbi:conserved protein of unknown function [uncultured Sphingopyxis sp.]|uniref:AAA+ ATPase domain-containing protein n=2 Tax=uncultured Sphingopyxis sp. TaxID=310581 RepID=A0A1Y5PR76_9SPHN|nr:conserved protein of unknown function [uncultured Sphingopyxis sp.]
MTNVPSAGGMPSEHSAFVPALSNRNDPKSARPSDLLSGRSPRPGSLAERSERVAKKVAALRRIRLPYPRQLAVMAEFDEVRAIGVEMRGLPQLGMTLFEVTGCGKTTAAQQYVERQQHAAAPGSTPTLLVRLDNSGTARALYVEILSALGDGFAMNGTEQNLRRRALDALGDAGTELVIIDESHHGGRRSGFGGEITSSVKLMLDAGVAPVALLGTEQAVPIFAKDRELSGRLTAPCNLGPLRWFDEYDRELWVGFLQALDDQMVADAIVSKATGLAGEGLDLALIEATNGVIGQLMGTVRTALREAIRDGRDSVSLEDLVAAVDGWNVAHGFTESNPLRDL